MGIKLKSASLTAAQELRSFLDKNNAVISSHADGVQVLVYHKYAPAFKAHDCVVLPDMVEQVGYIEPAMYSYPWRLERLTYMTDDWAVLATLLDNASAASIPLIMVG